MDRQRRIEHTLALQAKQRDTAARARVAHELLLQAKQQLDLMIEQGEFETTYTCVLTNSARTSVTLVLKQMEDIVNNLDVVFTHFVPE